jgi:hypothetical protein
MTFCDDRVPVGCAVTFLRCYRFWAGICDLVVGDWNAVWCAFLVVVYFY